MRIIFHLTLDNFVKGAQFLVTYKGKSYPVTFVSFNDLLLQWYIFTSCIEGTGKSKAARNVSHKGSMKGIYFGIFIL